MPDELSALAIWAILIGVLLSGMALSSGVLKRLPLSEAMIYLLIGYGMSSSGIALLHIDVQEQAPLFTHISEAALLVSLFSAGLKLQLPLRDLRWRLALRLALLGMLFTVALIAALGVALGLPVGAAILLGATLAPTDPVLASDVQVANASDRDKLRFSLTGESGLNDGTAFPIAVLGLSLITGDAFDWSRWLLRDVLWSIGVGVLLGTAIGTGIARLVLYLRVQLREALGLDEFLVLGVLALSWGLALLCAASTFLAVFAAGLAMARTTASAPPNPALPAHHLDEQAQLAADPDHAAPLMIHGVLSFNEKLERIAEVSVVILVGALLPLITIDASAVVITLALLTLVRPLAVNAALLGTRIDRGQRRLLSWFGIRGIGSVYYLIFALDHGLPQGQQSPLISMVLLSVAASIVVHGISVTPLMTLYSRRRDRSRDRQS